MRRAARWFLQRAVSGADAEFVLGDIEEEYGRLASARPLYARMWLWRQTIGAAFKRLTQRRGTVPVSRPGDGDGLRRDLTGAVRVLVRTPAVTVTVVVTLALGIGAPATMFSIAHGILRPLPFDPGQRLVSIADRDPETVDRLPIRGDHVLALRDAQTALVDIAALDRRAFHVSDGAERAERVAGAALSPWGFDLLGVRPLLGRGFTETDARSGGEPVVVISHALWVSRFDQAMDVLGRTMRVDDTVRTIVGVMSEGFGFPVLERLWIPLAVNAGATSGNAYEVFGWLRPGGSIEEARAQFSALSARLPERAGSQAEQRRITVDAYRDVFIGDDAPVLLLTMTTVVSFVLIIACANVANVLLARAAERSREIAIRTAIGGSRWRIVRQLLSETVIMALLGGAGGIVLAMTVVGWFNRTIGHRIERFWVDVRIDPVVLVFAATLVGVATIAAGLVPALRATRVDIMGVLRDEVGGVGSFRLGRISRWLVGGEVALSCALLVLAGLMIRGVLNTTVRGIAFETDDIVTARVVLATFDYPDLQSITEYQGRFAEEWAGSRQAASIAFMSSLPGHGTAMHPVVSDARAAGASAELAVQRRSVAPGFGDLFGLTVQAGRWFDERDREDAVPVAAVNREFAQQLFADGSAIGRRIRFGTDDTLAWREIVGVVDDHGAFVAERAGAPGVYLPVQQDPQRRPFVAVRSRGEATARMLDAVATAADPRVPMYDVASLDATLREANLPSRTFGILFGGFGAAALVLSMVGLYGVLAFSVTRRRREMGLRRALGGGPSHVIRVTLLGAARPVVVGIVAGLALAIMVAPVLSQLFSEADPRDPLVYALVSGMLAVTGLAAGLIPSVRAARVHPMTALRYG